MSFNARTSEQQAAICHCKECKTDIFYSLELGLNVVGIPIKNFAQVIAGNYNNMIINKVSDETFIALSIWCPTCNRIQNKDVYIPNWKKVN